MPYYRIRRRCPEPAYCLHFAYYNFCRVHRPSRLTPAMEAKITDHIRELSELLA